MIPEHPRTATRRLQHGMTAVWSKDDIRSVLQSCTHTGTHVAAAIAHVEIHTRPGRRQARCVPCPERKPSGTCLSKGSEWAG